MCPYVNIFGLELPLYGLISLVGILVSAAVAYPLSRRVGVPFFDIMTTALFGGLGVFLGSHLLYALTRAEDIILTFSSYGDYDSLWEFLRELADLSSGMVFYGGLYGGLLFGYLWIRGKRNIISPVADVFAVIIPLFHAFGRVGCFFAGCCYGIECRYGFSGRVLSSGSSEQIKRLPVQLIEAVLLLILFAVLLILFCKKTARGRLMCIYLLSYAVLRFVLEFFRGDAIRGHFLFLSTSQWISLATVIGVTLYILCRRKNRNTF